MFPVSMVIDTELISGFKILKDSSSVSISPPILISDKAVRRDKMIED